MINGWERAVAIVALAVIGVVTVALGFVSATAAAP